MSEMVERVAKAIYSRSYLGITGTGTPNAPLVITQVPWERASETHHKWCISQAEAAITAMREPTEAMEIEGHGTAIDVDGGTHIVGATTCWQAMIDEALK